MNKLINMFLLASLAICFAACSDDDEPKSEPEFRFDNLQNIMGDQIWSTTNRVVVFSDGSEYDPVDPDDGLGIIGDAFMMYFEIKGDELHSYFDSDALPGWVKYMNTFTFDRNTGDIMLGNNRGLYGRVVRVSDGEMEIHSDFGTWEKPGETEDDKGSYIRYILQPETDPEMIETFRNIEEVIDRRSE